MHTPKLIIYLQSFSDQDWKDITAFSRISITDHSSQAQVLSFYKSRRQNLFIENWGRDKLLNTIKPKIKLHALANVMAKLVGVVEEFFIWQELQNSSQRKVSLLLSNLAKRALKREFSSIEEKHSELFQNDNINIWHKLPNIEKDHLKYFGNLTDNVEDSKVVLERLIVNTNSLYENLMYYYLIEIRNREVMINEDWTPYKTLIKSLTNEDEFAEICTKLIDLKVYKRGADFLSLKNIYHQRGGKLSYEMRYTILVHITSYLNYQIKKGNYSHNEELLDFYTEGISSGLLINNGKMTPLRFANILNIACGMNEFNWAMEFVEEYASLVDAEFLEDTKRLALAEIKFKMGHHDDVIQQLMITKYSKFDQEVKARWLRLCSIYSLNRNQVDFMKDQVRSFKYFLKRNESRIDKWALQGILNLCKYLIILSKPYDPKQTRQLIVEETYLVYRKWLLSLV